MTMPLHRASGDEPPVTFTWAGFRRGVRLSLPMQLGQLPFGLVVGIAAQAHGLSLSEAALMSALVFAGSSQLVALGAWTIPAPLVAAILASIIVNMRFALMGPLLAPWLDHLRGLRRWGSLFFLVELDWALSLKEIAAKRRDAAFFLGVGAALWIIWVLMTMVGYVLGEIVAPAPGHPLFFAAIAVFIAMLVPMWRGRRDLVPWAVAALTALAISKLLPGTPWHIVCGAVAGGIAGAVRDRFRPI